METPYTGGCACGAVRYDVAATPVAEVHCQCRDCQRRGGTGHTSYVVFASRTGVATRGPVAEWRVAGDSGNEKIHAFCPVCGVPVWLTFAANPDMIAVHPASLDDPARFSPGMVTYTIRGFGWDRMDPALMAFQKGPGG